MLAPRCTVARPARTRRTLLQGIAGTAIWGLTASRRASVVLAQGTPVSGDASSEWAFTDDVGKTVTLPRRPERVVADLNIAASLWDFGVRPIGVSGWTVGTEAAWGDIDRATLDLTANTGAPDPDLEKMIALEADLFVTVVWGDDEVTYPWSFTDDAAFAQTDARVPVIGLSGTGSADENMARVAELAALLGADLDTPELVEARATYEATRAEFSRAAEASAVTTLFGSADPAELYVANPPDWADLTFFQQQGLNIIAPDVPPGDYWQALSAEQAGMYRPDVFFASVRAGAMDATQLAAHPTYGAMPAVRAGQVAPWNQDFIQSYQGLTTAMQVVIDALATAKVVT